MADIPFSMTVQASSFVAACAGGYGTVGHQPVVLTVRTSTEPSTQRQDSNG